MENSGARKTDDPTRDGGDALSASLRYQLTCTLPRVAPCGLPPAVSRAAALAAWVCSLHQTLDLVPFAQSAIALVLARRLSREVGRLGDPSPPMGGRGTSLRWPLFYSLWVRCPEACFGLDAGGTTAVSSVDSNGPDGAGPSKCLGACPRFFILSRCALGLRRSERSGLFYARRRRTASRITPPATARSPTVVGSGTAS